MSSSEPVRQLVRVARRVRSLGSGFRRRGRLFIAGVCAIVALACAAVVGLVEFMPAGADNVIEGKPVDAATTQTLMVAALSCPILSGPRLAGTMMANTKMDLNAPGGVAGLPAATFTKWAPWPQAQVNDPDANIYALAHYLCALAGQVRQAGIKDVLWDDALAAQHSGLDAVRKSAGVPADTQTYVDTVNGYSAWYATQPSFVGAPSGSPAVATTSSDGTTHVGPVTGTPPVPDSLVASIVAAGSICSTVSPPMVASQLAASSGFDPNLRSSTGAMGIAQFLPNMWMQYAPSVLSSPWDPPTAIGVLGKAMCDLVHQFSLIAAKPYDLVLAAFRVGVTAVRQAGGVPQMSLVRQFVSQVASDTGVYSQDARLGTPTKPKPSTSAGPSTSASPSPKASQTAAAPSQSTASKPPTAKTGSIVGVLGLCVDVPNANSADDTQLQIWPCDNTAAQSWTVGTDGTIRALGKCMDAEGFGTANGTIVVLHTCNGGTNQQWKHQANGELTPAYYPGICLDANGTNLGWGSLLQVWACLGVDNQKWTLP
jgi:hypothetical protein